MEQYRHKLRTGNRITAVAAAVLIAFSVLFMLAEADVVRLPAPAGDSHYQSMWRGFISGGAFGIAALMIFYMIRTARAMRSEAALKTLYRKDHDERQIQIWTAARARATQIFLLSGLVAGVVSGYFSMTVGITILACVVAHSLIALGCKMYYSRKY